jgi:hypothetical protein
MRTSASELDAALEKWNDARQQWERARAQLAAAQSAQVPAVATALMKVRVDTLEAEACALFEAAMVYMDRRPLGT